MALDSTPAPGSFTVPPLHGWQGIVVVLLVAVAVGVAFLLIGAVVTGRRTSPEWDAWLDGRSQNRQDDHEPTRPQAPGRPQRDTSGAT